MSCVHPVAAYLPRLTTDWLLKTGSQPVLRMHTRAYNGVRTMLRRLALTVRKLRFAEIVRVETLQLLYVKWQETAAVLLSAIRF